MRLMHPHTTRSLRMHHARTHHVRASAHAAYVRLASFPDHPGGLGMRLTYGHGNL